MKGILNKTKSFIFEVRAEMQKVTWSTREELVGSTAVVLMTMFILSAFIGMCDFILSIFVTAFLR